MTLLAKSALKWCPKHSVYRWLWWFHLWAKITLVTDWLLFTYVAHPRKDAEKKKIFLHYLRLWWHNISILKCLLNKVKQQSRGFGCSPTVHVHEEWSEVQVAFLCPLVPSFPPSFLSSLLASPFLQSCILTVTQLSFSQCVLETVLFTDSCWFRNDWNKEILTDRFSVIPSSHLFWTSSRQMTSGGATAEGLTLGWFCLPFY